MIRTSRALVVHPSLKHSETTAEQAARRTADLPKPWGSLAPSIWTWWIDVILPLRQIRPATLIGPRQASTSLRPNGLKSEKIDLVIVDAPLSPIQQRNLERAMEGQGDRSDWSDPGNLWRTRPHEGRFAAGRACGAQLSALPPRALLDPSGTPARRPRLHVGGPGESQIELDRRRIDERITRIEGPTRRR